MYNYLLDHGPLPIPKVQKIFAQLVGAVSYVHRQSCVHRDLKLENILFDKNENVKLVDFGFTREYEGRINHLQTFCGTICYSAPEMLKGEKYAGEKVDVWSLGIILFALLTGELPFDDDDDNVTRKKIMSEEPKFPEHMPDEAVNLIKALLSKRPLLRPSLPDVLAHSFLADHASTQQVILDIHAPAPFTTALEKDCLERMRSAGVDIDSVIESVLAQKCNALAGWWALLLEREERKMIRREKRRKERDADSKSLRRLSAASSRLERMATMLQDVDEDGGLTRSFIRSSETSGSRHRGRPERRSAHYYTDYTTPELPQLPEAGRESSSTTPRDENPPTPIDKDSIRSVSTSRHRRPIPPPKEGVIRSARSRGSTLHLVTTSEALGGGSTNGTENGHPKPKKKPSQAIIATWKNWTHWFMENTTRRKKGHERRASRSTPNLPLKDDGKVPSPRPQTSKYPTSTSTAGAQGTAALPKGVVANGHVVKGHTSLAQGSVVAKTSSGLSAPPNPHVRPPRIITGTQSYKRQSLSPSPLTPRSTIRRPSAGLRGRKSTSSSVSSVRSLHHHHHTHSKASSTSSTGSVATAKTPLARGHSPHHSVKVLPATPTTNTFPSNIRLVRAAPAPISLFNENMSGGHSPSVAPGSPNPFASGIQFAKRKKNLFKGPSVGLGGSSGMGGGGSSARGHRTSSHSRNTSGSGLGRRSGELPITQEEEEEEDEEEEGGAGAGGYHQHGHGADVPDEEIEEVEMFHPIISRPGENVEESIIEDGDVSPMVEDLGMKGGGDGGILGGTEPEASPRTVVMLDDGDRIAGEAEVAKT